MAFGLRALTPSGALAGWAIGTVALTTTGWAGGLLLAVFFATSSGISRLFPPAPSAREREREANATAKADRRDALQVLANGGPAAAGSLAAIVEPALGVWLLGAGLAAAGADTWATGIGMWSGRTPRDIWTRQAVTPGTSGGVTLPGSLAAAGGAAVVALPTGGVLGSMAWGGVALSIGVMGMVVDSILGATLQGQFQCPACGSHTECRLHRCGARTEHRKGLAWCSNDVVNFLATGSAVIAAWAVWSW